MVQFDLKYFQEARSVVEFFFGARTIIRLNSLVWNLIGEAMEYIKTFVFPKKKKKITVDSTKSSSSMAIFFLI